MHPVQPLNSVGFSSGHSWLQPVQEWFSPPKSSCSSCSPIMRKSWECSRCLLSPSFSHFSKPELCAEPFYPIYCIIPIPRLLPGKEITLLMQTLNTLSTSEEKLAALCKKYAELVSPGAGGGCGSSGWEERDIPGPHWSSVVSWALCSAGFLGRKRVGVAGVVCEARTEGTLANLGAGGAQICFRTHKA